MLVFMAERVFVDEEETLDRDTPLPVRSGVRSVATPNRVQSQLDRQKQYADILPYGTLVAETWSPQWVSYVSQVERQQGYAICGSKRSESDIDRMIRAEKFDREETEHDPLLWVCTFKAGLNTAHVGEGRCHMHGGNSSPLAKFSLIQNADFSYRVREYFEQEDLTDLRGAIAMVWAAANAILEGVGEGETMSMERSKEVGALMTRVGNLTKQHNEIIDKRKLSIEVPEFISWAEHLYELAVKYILDGSKDVQGFLKEAQSYVNATVTLAVGINPDGNSHRTSQPRGSDSVAEVLRPGRSES